MAAPCIDTFDLATHLADRDPETLLGPLLWLLTRLAHGREHASDAHRLEGALAAHSAALAAHPGVPVALRLAAGALAIEHRCASHRLATLPERPDAHVGGG